MEIPKFQHPFTCLVAGATGSGKSYLVRNMIEYSHFVIEKMPNVPKIVWCYGIYSPLYGKPIPGKHVDYHDGLVSESMIKEERPDLVVIDDLMWSSNDRTLCDLFTRGSHHLNFSVIFITQNLFAKGKFMRDISLNCHYFIVMKSLRIKGQVVELGRQIFHKNSKFLVEAFDHATKEKFGYLVIDLHPSTEEKLRVRTRIFPLNGIIDPIFYLPKNV